jgi:hypothetical protein
LSAEYLRIYGHPQTPETVRSWIDWLGTTSRRRSTTPTLRARPRPMQLRDRSSCARRSCCAANSPSATRRSCCTCRQRWTAPRSRPSCRASNRCP